MSLLAQMQAIAELIEEALAGEVDELQVVPYRWFNPTPPTIDIYIGDPAVEQMNYGYAEADAFLVVRARVLSADNQAGQEQLVGMIDPRSPLSVGAAISADRTLKGTADNSVVEACTGYRIYEDVAGTAGLLGCEWRVRVVQ